MLPVVKLVSSFFAHIFFVIIMFVIFLIARVPITLKSFLVIYFSFALSVLSLAVIYITSAINVFFKDMSQIVTILLQFGIWMAPIMYDESLFVNRSPLIYRLLKFNPIYYIVKGYRYSMVGEQFKDIMILTTYFWGFTIILFIIGKHTFNKLKPHFADVL